MEWNQILNKFPDRCCLHCGSLAVTAGLLCRPCLNAISEEELFFDEGAWGRSYSLFSWPPDESDLTSALIAALKGPFQSRAWDHYAEIFIRQRLQFSLTTKPLRFVVPPAKDPSRKHAEHWGQAFARRLGSECFSPFMNLRTEEQKRTDRNVRSLRRFDLREEFSSLLKDSTEVLWVLADDIITTGSTAKAIYEALQKPPHFEVWTLAQRGVFLRSLQESVITTQ